MYQLKYLVFVAFLCGVTRVLWSYEHKDSVNPLNDNLRGSYNNNNNQLTNEPSGQPTSLPTILPTSPEIFMEKEGSCVGFCGGDNKKDGCGCSSYSKKRLCFDYRDVCGIKGGGSYDYESTNEPSVQPTSLPTSEPTNNYDPEYGSYYDESTNESTNYYGPDYGSYDEYN